MSTYKVKFANDRHSIDVYVNVCICIQDMYSTADGCLCGWVKVIQLFQCPIQRHVNSQYFDYCDMRTVLINGELERGLFFFFFFVFPCTLLNSCLVKLQELLFCLCCCLIIFFIIGLLIYLCRAQCVAAVSSSIKKESRIIALYVADFIRLSIVNVIIQI